MQIKTTDKKDLYIHKVKRAEPLGPDTGIFLEFIVASDLVGLGLRL